MVGETRFHRWIHKASLGRNAGKRKDSFREEGKKRAPTARTVYVSLDRALVKGAGVEFDFDRRLSFLKIRVNPFPSNNFKKMKKCS